MYWWLQFLVRICNLKENLGDHLSAILKILKNVGRKKMLTEQKPLFLHLLTVSSYLLGALAKLKKGSSAIPQTE